MNKSLLIIAIVVGIVGTGSVFAIMPYFMDSTVDEALPSNVITQSKMEDKAAMMEERAMMEKKMSVMTYSGTFVGVGDGIHDVQGIAKTIPLEDGNNVLRLENFKSTNGPDLYVYLATDDRSSEFVNLGNLKASNGNQNYDIPVGIDLEKYSNVLIWCKAFGILFGNAELSSK